MGPNLLLHIMVNKVKSEHLIQSLLRQESQTSRSLQIESTPEPSKFYNLPTIPVMKSIMLSASCRLSCSWVSTYPNK